MSNTNVLQGVQCPECKSYGPFDIVATAHFLGVTDDGCDEFEDMDWVMDNGIRCCACNYSGKIYDFEEK